MAVALAVTWCSSRCSFLQDLCAAPGAQGSSDQSQEVCMVLFSVQVQGSIVGLGLCTGTKKWFNKKIEL